MTIKNQIKEVLSTGQKTTQEIKDYILIDTTYSASSIDVMLWEMTQDEDIIRVERGVYSLPHEKGWFKRLFGAVA